MFIQKRLAKAGVLLAVLLAACGSEAPPPAPQLRASLASAAVQMPSAADYTDVLQMLFVGYFGRPADPAGLAFHANVLAGNGAPATLFELSQSYYSNPAVRATIDGFGTSPESQDLYPGNNAAFVGAIYANLFNRAPDPAGQAYWVALLDAKGISRGNAAIVIMAGALGADRDIVRNKTLTARNFTARLHTPERAAAYSGMAPNTLVRQMLATVGAGGAAAQFDTLIDTLLALPAAPASLSASGLSTLAAGRAHLRFDAARAAAGYVATCSAAGDVRSASGPASPLLVEGLQAGVQYACSVKAFNQAGEGNAADPVLVNIPLANPNHVRFVYAIPTDRSVNAQWSDAIGAAAAHMQHWFKEQLGGRSFTVFAAQPDICRLPRNAAGYYSSNTWNTVRSDIQTACGVQLDRSDTDWIIYADVLHAPGTEGGLGAALPGLAQLPRQDLEGLGGAPCVTNDEGTQSCHPQSRWVGGLAHELGHSFGLPHPSGCGAGFCDPLSATSLMWLGYITYPATHLIDSDKDLLRNSRFIR